MAVGGGEQSEPEEDRANWGMLALAWLLYFAFAIISSSLFPLVTPIREDLDLDYAQMGIILGAWQLVYIVVAAPAGMLIDRIGTRLALLLGALIIAASGFARSLAVDDVTMLLAVALFGFGGPILSTGLPKLIAEWFTGKKRALASGIYITGSSVGGVVVLGVTNSLVMPLTGSWRVTLQFYSLVVLIIAGIWFVFGRASNGGGGGQAGQRSPVSMWTVVRNRAIWPIIIIGFAGFLGSHGFRSWLPQILEHEGMSPADAGLVAAMAAVAGVVGSVTIVRIAAVGYRKLTTIMLLVVLGLSLVVVGLADGPLLLAAVVVEGFCAGAIMPLMLNSLMEMPQIGAQALGAASGLYFAVGEMGGFLGPSLMGFLAETTGSFAWGILALALIMWAMLLPASTLNEADISGSQRTGQPAPSA